MKANPKNTHLHAFLNSFSGYSEDCLYGFVLAFKVQNRANADEHTDLQGDIKNWYQFVGFFQDGEIQAEVKVIFTSFSSILKRKRQIRSHYCVIFSWFCNLIAVLNSNAVSINLEPRFGQLQYSVHILLHQFFWNKNRMEWVPSRFFTWRDQYISLTPP